MGPMRAACRFAQELELRCQLQRVERVTAELYGSLALTGIGHGTDRAVLLGLAGNEPALIDPTAIESTVAGIRTQKRIELAGQRSIQFDESSRSSLSARNDVSPGRANSASEWNPVSRHLMRTGALLDQRTFFSIGGGFIVEDGVDPAMASVSDVQLPFPFHSAAELLKVAQGNSLSIDQVMLANECARLDGERVEGGELPENRVRAGIDAIWTTMKDCVQRGIETEGILPGGLNVRRRAHRLAERLREKEAAGQAIDPLAPLDWVTVYAMAVNEENAAGGRVVTAPTNGAAGVVPAVAHFYERFVPGSDHEGILRFFLTSAAIGILYKENASISGAEVGCQGEVGVACSMAAGGLTAALGGSNGQVEHAAEIAMEHNLGMTCDPIGGLVQIPCIERNAMGAVKAVHASRIAMSESEEHKVSLDQVIRTMYLTGLDMQSRYKETSLAGLALNIIEC